MDLSNTTATCFTCETPTLIGTLSETQQKNFIKGFNIICPQCLAARKNFGARKLAKLEQRLEQSGQCFYCGEYSRLTKDHVIAKSVLKRAGIDSSQTPIAYCCSRCNMAKGALDIFEWLSTFPVGSYQWYVLQGLLPK
jgi:5-methylcytosine-specific restriction endonuclease McrA